MSGNAFVGYGAGIKTVAASGTPERMHATEGQYKCKKLLMWGRKAQITANTGIVYVGPDSADASSANIIAIAAGAFFELSAPEGQYIDPYNLYIDVATNADGVAWMALGVI